LYQVRILNPSRPKYVDREADNHGRPFIFRVPNELILKFADNLDVDDINAFARTSRGLNRLLTPYMYRRADHEHSIRARPYFLRAVDGSNLTAVRRFIEVGTSVNMKDTTNPRRPTSLVSCVQDGNIEVAKLLIEHGVNLSDADAWGWTPLHHAVRSESMARLLLDAGADVCATPGHEQMILYSVGTFEGTAIAQHFPHGRNYPADHDRNGPTPLHGAARNGTAETVQLILKAGANIQAANFMGETPLHIAAQAGRADNVETFLAWGANIEATSRLGFTPLLHAIREWGTGERTLAAAHRILHRAPRSDSGCWKGAEACVPSCLWTEYNHPVVDLLLDARVNILGSSDHDPKALEWAAAYVGSVTEDRCFVGDGELVRRETRAWWNWLWVTRCTSIWNPSFVCSLLGFWLLAIIPSLIFCSRFHCI
jgi:hypothetical protein